MSQASSNSPSPPPSCPPHEVHEGPAVRERLHPIAVGIDAHRPVRRRSGTHPPQSRGARSNSPSTGASPPHESINPPWLVYFNTLPSAALRRRDLRHRRRRHARIRAPNIPRSPERIVRDRYARSSIAPCARRSSWRCCRTIAPIDLQQHFPLLRQRPEQHCESCAQDSPTPVQPLQIGGPQGVAATRSPQPAAAKRGRRQRAEGYPALAALTQDSCDRVNPFAIHRQTSNCERRVFNRRRFRAK